MWIQVRSMDGRSSHRIDDLSKLTKIEDLRKILVDKFDIPVNQQRLFYRGKQLEDGHTLFDYDVGLNDIVQILKREIVTDYCKDDTRVSLNTPNKENKPSAGNKSNENDSLSKYFKVGDLVDGKDLTYGAWFEAKIVAIKPGKTAKVLQSSENSPMGSAEASSAKNSDDDNDDGLTYTVIFEDYEDTEDAVDLSLHCIRPRARKIIKFSDVKEGDKVMINYNIEEPNERGFWYDCEVTGKKQNRTKSFLVGTITMGQSDTKLKDCKIKFIDEIFAIEKNKILTDQKDSGEVVARTKMPKCNHCKDVPSAKCKVCSCRVCGGKDSPEKQIMCDECDLSFHLWCLQPPLNEIPEDDWYCPDCKNDETEVVRAGEKLKASKKKSKMASANSSTSRDWGKGMACVGRTKVCTIVPQNHFGAIPGVEVGTLWKFRLQVSESGIHRPHVAGIHGRESEGAYSIVLSGGYEDDLDEGEEFYYTGSGGRDLSGNKRCAEQSCDQTLTRMNKALAANCNAPINKDGAESKDWKGGKPVRVVRNCKGRKHSKYSPEEGNRYDGIYKVVKYWPEKGKSGFLVWRYLLRRDDPSPAPWTSAGKKRIKELGLEMQYPEGYLESLKEKEKLAEESTPKQKSKKKRELSDGDSPTPKKKKAAYKIPKEAEELIKSDKENKKLWDECLQFVKEGQQEFLKKVEVCFQCICCQELVFQPITTPCFHNICKVCLKRSFSAQVFTCPMCRQDLDKNIIGSVNDKLQKALLSLYPGYDAGR